MPCGKKEVDREKLLPITGELANMWELTAWLDQIHPDMTLKTAREVNA